MPIVKLQSSDGEVFSVEYDIIKVSTRIKQMIGNSELKEDHRVILELPIRKDVLLKVIEWVTYHKDDPPQLPRQLSLQNNERRTDNIPRWDMDFLDLPQDTICRLLKASSLLGIYGLLDVVSKTIANWINGRTPEEIRNTLHIINDFACGEENQAIEESNWWENVFET